MVTHFSNPEQWWLSLLGSESTIQHNDLTSEVAACHNEAHSVCYLLFVYKQYQQQPPPLLAKRLCASRHKTRKQMKELKKKRRRNLSQAQSTERNRLQVNLVTNMVQHVSVNVTRSHSVHRNPSWAVLNSQ